MKKIISILILLFATNNLVLGQSIPTSISQINSIEESLYLHCNTTTLLSGETLLFKVYAINPHNKTFSTVSKIGYVEMLDSQNNSVMTQKINLKNGTGQGDFFITTTLKTGNYKLITYTNWTLNKTGNGVYQTDVFIINPFERNDLTETDKKAFANNTQTDDLQTVQKEETTKANNNLLTVKTDKSKYVTREKINLVIHSALENGLKGNFSVSVRKTDSLPIAKPTNSVDFLNTVASKNNSNAKKSRFLPELRGEILSGKITAKDGSKNLNDKVVSLSIPGKYFGFKMAKTDESGRFNFILDEHPGASNAVIQVTEKDRSEYTITLEETEKPDFKTLTTANPLGLNSKNKSDIENRSIANQIENNYYLKKRDSLINSTKTIPFFHPLQKEYILDDYNRFPTLKETIIEILKEVYHKKSKETYSIHLRDYTGQGEAYGESLVMIDGLQLQDVNELFEYDMQNIYKVSLVNQGYVYGPKVFNGVINFVTKKSDYETKASGDFIKTVTLNRPQTIKKYFHPDYSEKKSERIPDYRYQLLWQPEVILTGEETTLSFFASDIKGEFQISIEGFTDNGNAVSIREFITIE
ncbi:hypothetical protein FLJC2902T_07860 [Flavobacterium limnosediminis JC2902]|uniref:TonB-dependent receptor plug domain-containing protein n=1 Tax=Flavobacterium limnosediminis JC2902 TaxID=1341181 RepID=V6ST81_9FLAO|nr:hypothetical protein [Flavobacterium limnosediminis]ESU29387.1 hypothetical protein FLJC2902T_07860 [Flavobacterium limnosediminis JC2902]